MILTVASCRIGTTARIKTSIVELQKSLYPTSAALAALPSYLRSTSKSEFKKFYVYLFNLLREEGQKSLGAETALVIWGVVLKDYKGKEEGAVFVPEDDDEVDSEDEDSEMARAKLASMQDAAASKADSGSDEAGGKLIQEFIEYGTASLFLCLFYRSDADIVPVLSLSDPTSRGSPPTSGINFWTFSIASDRISKVTRTTLPVRIPLNDLRAHSLTGCS